MTKTTFVDAKDHLMGRLSAAVAKELLLGASVVVVRTEEIVISGDLKRNKDIYLDFLNKRMNTNPRRGPFHHCAPSKIFQRSVRAMLPYKTPRGEQALKRLQVFEGVPTLAQKKKRVCVPAALRAVRLRPGSKFTRLSRLSTEFGWKHAGIISKLETLRKERSAAYYNKKQKNVALFKKVAAGLGKKDESVKKINTELKALGY